MQTATLGKFAALGLAIVAGGVVVYAVINAQSTKPQRATRPIADQPSTTEVEQLSGTDEGSYNALDPTTGEVRYRFTWTALDPEGDGSYTASNPTFLAKRDGVEVVLTADNAKIFWPDQEGEPESGELTGGVRITVQGISEDPLANAAKGKDNPGWLATMIADDLRFEALLGQVQTVGPITVESPGLRTLGTGMTLRISEVTGRLEYFRLDAHERTTIDPVAMRDRPTTSRPERDESRAVGEDREPRDPAALRTDHYQVAVSGDVRIVQGDRSAAADQVRGWATLLGGALPEGAIADLTTKSDSDAASTSGSSGSSGSSRDERSTAPITVSSSGPIEVAPLRDRPAELAQERLAVEFSSPSSGAVVLTESSTGRELRCGSLAWGFTTARLAVDGVGGQLGVVATLPGEGTILTGALRADLLKGSVTFPGAGRLEAEPGALGKDMARATFAWRDGADITLDATGGSVLANGRPLLKTVLARGAVQGSADAVTLDSESLRADFRPHQGPDGRTALLSMATLAGPGSRVAFITDGKPGAVVGDELEVAFTHDTTDPATPLTSPRIASARGSASADLAGDTLKGEEIVASLYTDNLGETKLRTVAANGEARAMTADGYETSGQTLFIDARDETLEVTGEPALVAYLVDAQGNPANDGDQLATGVTILSQGITLSRPDARIDVVGPGKLTYVQANPTPQDGTPSFDQLAIDWQRSMQIDDSAGIAEFSGEVALEASRGILERSTMRGGRLTVNFTPNLTDKGIPKADQASILQRVQVDGADGNDASAEGRRYIADPSDADGRRLVTTLALLGQSIVAQGGDNTVSVDGPGKLVIDDRSPQPSATTRTQPDAIDGRGTTVFDWVGGFRLDTQQGIASFERSARMRHLPIGADALASIEAERLLAFSDPLTRGSSDAPQGGGAGSFSFRGAQASGAVYAQQGQKQLITDELEYQVERDADGSPLRSELIATTSPGNRVTYVDAETGQHFAAERLILDLMTNRWRATGAEQLTAPLTAR